VIDIAARTGGIVVTRRAVSGHVVASVCLLLGLTFTTACAPLPTSPLVEEPSTQAPTNTTIGTPPPDDWGDLRRPLPVAGNGQSCAVATGRHLSDKFAPGFGDGPAYAVGGERASFVFDPGARDDRGWFPVKVLWVADARYAGCVLVRGFSVEDGTRIHFSGPFSDELRIDWRRATPEDWREWASYTWVPGPGCFSWQVDTADGSDVITFEVN